MINLMNGDCIEKMKEIPDGSVDMILTDPPYGTTGHKWDNCLDPKQMWKEIKRIRKERTPILLFASQPFTTNVINSNPKEFKYCWYWKKQKGSGFQFSHHQPMRIIEEITVFYKKSPSYDYVGEPYKNDFIKKFNTDWKYSDTCPLQRQKLAEKKYTHRTKNNFLEFKRDGVRSKNRFHPTQKPIELLKYLIETYTSEGETVLDFTMGSGSTGVAAKQLNRDFIGIELDEEYFNIAKRRINEEVQKSAN